MWPGPEAWHAAAASPCRKPAPPWGHRRARGAGPPGWPGGTSPSERTRSAATRPAPGGKWLECWSDPARCDTKDNPHSRCAGQACPLIATFYTAVFETPTHWFVQYLPYHPLDWKVTNGHEHDTESLLAVVAKAGGGLGYLQVIETRFHLYWYQYAADIAVTAGADDIDGPVHFDAATGRPVIYSQMAGHGLCGGFSPPNRLLPDLSLTCNHRETPHIDRTGVRYSPDAAPAMPLVADGRTVEAGVRLVDLWTSVWPHLRELGPGRAFASAIDYQGERCARFACPTQFGGAWEGNEGQPPAEPWAQPGGNGVTAIGDQFFDPAYTMSKRLTFPQPYSLDYCFNQYLGVPDSCDGADAGPAEDGGGPDAGPDAGPETDAGSGADAGLADAGAGTGDGGAPDEGATSTRLGGCAGGAEPTGVAAAALALALVLAARTRRRA